MSIGAFVISFIALLAAGIGIMNIMLVSVTERTKEIGIRKSIGARSRDILRQFLTEAVFISEAGGIIGIMLGVIGGDLLALALKVDLIFPWGWAIAGLIVCSAIGIGFGFYPAYRAAVASIRSRRCVTNSLLLEAERAKSFVDVTKMRVERTKLVDL